MYCLQWLIPVLLIPKPINPDLIHYTFLVLHLLSFFLEKRPCTICSIIFLTAAGLICYSCWDSCLIWSCSTAATTTTTTSTHLSSASSFSYSSPVSNPTSTTSNQVNSSPTNLNL